MNDRELLELAAKAAGIDAEWHNDDDADFDAAHEGMFLKGERSPDNSKYWNSLHNDGDALRLAVKLRMQIDILDRSIYALAMGGTKVCELDRADPQAAARRAVTRAAAEIGKGMK
jgi:hypothetical protein